MNTVLLALQCKSNNKRGSLFGFSNARWTRGNRAANSSRTQQRQTTANKPDCILTEWKFMNVKDQNPHLHNSDVISSVDLGILGKLLSQGRYTSLQMLSLTRVLPLNIRIHTSGIQLKIRQNLVRVFKSPREQGKERTIFHWGGDSWVHSLMKERKKIEKNELSYAWYQPGDAWYD